MASLALRKLKRGGGGEEKQEGERAREKREGGREGEQSVRVIQKERKREEGFNSKQTVNEKKGIQRKGREEQRDRM